MTTRNKQSRQKGNECVSHRLCLWPSGNADAKHATSLEILMQPDIRLNYDSHLVYAKIQIEIVQ